ncbi:MAG TPA: response regulator [Candidatus Acidoferrales bacterium]|nr:response regulator [Candidatus Acidoferrales bacterium]
MRPKKRVLVACDNEDELSLMKFMLETNGYRVVCGSNFREAINVIHAETILEMLLLVMPLDAADNVIEAAARRFPGMARIMIVESLDAADRYSRYAHLDALLLAPRARDLLERMKFWTARKRGPKTQHASDVATDAEATQCSA